MKLLSIWNNLNCNTTFIVTYYIPNGLDVDCEAGPWFMTRFCIHFRCSINTNCTYVHSVYRIPYTIQNVYISNSGRTEIRFMHSLISISVLCSEIIDFIRMAQRFFEKYVPQLQCKYHIKCESFWYVRWSGIKFWRILLSFIWIVSNR